MSNRLNQEREKELQPKRMDYALEQLGKLEIGIIMYDDTLIKFIWKGSVCVLYPYSGWHTGKTIKDGRGIEKLIEQLKK